MSSDILSRELDIENFGAIYAGAQKNIGPAGLAIVVVRKDLLGLNNNSIPSFWAIPCRPRPFDVKPPYPLFT